MANIVFIAVQCCQCSTMQVKQQKKSSNKWTCAVCNEKQSVRKVFARGFMAKDIRKFVQSFNMSRSFAEEGLQLTADCEASFPDPNARSAEIQEEENEEKKKKKMRVNWNEYLDKDDLHADEFGAGVEGAELEPKIVTEWPEELLKGPKLKSRDFSRGRQCEASYKPVFTKRNRDFVCQGKEMGSEPTKSKDKLTGEGIINGRENPIGNLKLSQKVQPAKTTPVAKFGASKWDQYIEENDGNLCLTERECDSKAADDSAGRQEYDLEVEEDIHPDFL